MIKETLKYVDKVWGEEVVIVNSDKYCCKMLLVNQDAVSSTHRHLKKTETFYTLEGYGLLIVEGKQHILAPFTRPKTIEAGERHSYKALSPLIILEVSTTHSDDDVERFALSKEYDEECKVFRGDKDV